MCHPVADRGYRTVYSKESLLRIGIIGLGYVGLPLALLFVRQNFQVTGIDIDAHKVQELMKGKSYITDVSDDQLSLALQSGRLHASHQFQSVSTLDVLIICVPTPLTPTFGPDLSYLQSALLELKPFLRAGQLIVLESSTYPGTTEEVVVPLVESSGLLVGQDIFVAYSPERVDPGRPMSLEEIPKIVSGVTELCRDKIVSVYQSVFKYVVPVSNTRTAEMVKILENTQRLINISLVNEMGTICREMQINIWEVIDAAGTKPYGYTVYFPGPGIGGHCIPVDPMYMKWKANQFGLQTNLIDAAHQINQTRPFEVIRLLEQTLHVETLKGKRIFVLGVAYKKDINDTRESPALLIMEKLRNLGVSLAYHDPLVGEVVIGSETLQSMPIAPAVLEESDCVLILTDHSAVDYDEVVGHSRLIVDTRNATRNVQEKPNVVLF